MFADLTYDDIWRAAFADGTWNAYESSWKRFTVFLKCHAFRTGNAFAFDIDLFAAYIVWRFRTTGVKGATIKHDISGINSVLHGYGIGINLHNRNSARLVILYRGCDRWRAKYGIGTTRYYRRAMVDKMLDPIVLSVEGQSLWARTIRSLLLFAKHTAFRPHNYVYTKTGGFCRIGNVRFSPNIQNPKCFIVTLPRTKTHQIDARFPETRTVKCRCDKPCPVHSLADLLKNRMNNKHEALFLLDNGFPVTYYRLKKMLRILCGRFDLDHHYYTPYCLRIGEATDRTLRGEPLEKTMKFVNWKSKKSAMVYIRPDNEDFVKFE